MSDSLRTDRSRALDAASEADRDAKIEQLLLVGLDHYFATQYDHAINIWTRALFLDRSHARARAYIERARSALAERQRESDELLHSGVAAFERGEGGEARRLLQAALDGGAPSDEALAVLDRLNRLEATAEPPALSRREQRQPLPSSDARQSRWGLMLILVAAALPMLAVGVYVLTASDRFGWRSHVGLQDVPAALPSPLARNGDLPLPRRGEMALARARALAARGHLGDALSSLDLVRLTDPQKAEADQLRSEIQRQLLSLTSRSRAMPGRSPEPQKADPRVP